MKNPDSYLMKAVKRILRPYGFRWFNEFSGEESPASQPICPYEPKEGTYDVIMKRRRDHRMHNCPCYLHL